MSSQEFDYNRKYLDEIAERKSQILIELEKQDQIKKPSGVKSKIVMQPRARVLH